MAVPAGPGGGPVSPPGPLSSPRPRSGVSSACRGAGLGLAEPRKEGREGGRRRARRRRAAPCGGCPQRSGSAARSRVVHGVGRVRAAGAAAAGRGCAGAARGFPAASAKGCRRPWGTGSVPRRGSSLRSLRGKPRRFVPRSFSAVVCPAASFCEARAISQKKKKRWLETLFSPNEGDPKQQAFASAVLHRRGSNGSWRDVHLSCAVFCSSCSACSFVVSRF